MKIIRCAAIALCALAISAPALADDPRPLPSGPPATSQKDRCGAIEPFVEIVDHADPTDPDLPPAVVPMLWFDGSIAMQVGDPSVKPTAAQIDQAAEDAKVCSGITTQGA